MQRQHQPRLAIARYIPGVVLTDNVFTIVDSVRRLQPWIAALGQFQDRRRQNVAKRMRGKVRNALDTLACLWLKSDVAGGDTYASDERRLV
jgi:hypothetical protein